MQRKKAPVINSFLKNNNLEILTNIYDNELNDPKQNNQNPSSLLK